MRHLALVRALALLFGAALLVPSCVIDELEFDPMLPAPDGSTGTDPTTCEAYCDIVQANCTGANRAYFDDNDCKRLCSLLPSGNGVANPMGTNTVACRRFNAQQATNEPDAYCPFAGPGGGGRCGSNCESYCLLRQQLCSTITGQVTEVTTCLEQCPALIDAPPFIPDSGAKGDTIQCRLNHLVNASQSPAFAERHCWHTSIIPDRDNATPPPCADEATAPGDCNSYCDLVMFSCQGDQQVYDSVQQCRAACRAFPLGVAADTGDPPEQERQNTVGCRRYHAYAALGDAPYHCPHAGPMGDGHCGDAVGNNCQSYCRLLKRGCPARFFATFLPGATLPGTMPDNPAQDDLGSCEQTCLEVIGDDGGTGKDSGYSIKGAPVISSDDDSLIGGDRGDLLQCRVYYAVQAVGGLSGTPDAAACDAAFGEAPPCQ